MRTTTFDEGGGGGCGPQGSPRVRRAAGLALVVAILLLAFGLGAAIAAAYEALEDMQARGEMDPTW
jgi:hypothetical protein